MAPLDLFGDHAGLLPEADVVLIGVTAIFEIPRSDGAPPL